MLGLLLCVAGSKFIMEEILWVLSWMKMIYDYPCLVASTKIDFCVLESWNTRSVKVNQWTRHSVFWCFLVLADLERNWRYYTKTTSFRFQPFGRRRSALVERSAMWWTTMRLSSRYEAKLSRLGNQVVASGWNMEQIFSEQTGYCKSRCTQWAWISILLRNNPGLILSCTQFQCVSATNAKT